MIRNFLHLPIVALVALSTTACITRTAKEDVVNTFGLNIYLRGEKRGSEWIDKGYDHPASVSPVRMAHILSRVDLRKNAKKGLERVPAIDLDKLYPIADGVSRALESAGPGQQVCVQSIRNETTWGIFDHDFLTNFLVYMENDILYVYVTRYHWEIPERRVKRLPEPHVGENPMKFNIMAGRGMMLVSETGVAVQWRDDVFRRPTRTRVTPGGKVVRKTILMESLEEDVDVSTPATRPEIPPNLSAETLRDLADLEASREDGSITETEYYIKRREIIDRDPAAQGP